MVINIALLLAFSASALFPIAGQSGVDKSLSVGQEASAQAVVEVSQTPVAANAISDSVVEKAALSVSGKTKTAKKMTVLATAYTSDPAETDNTPFVTASGSVTRDGVVASNFLPLGTRLTIPKIYGDKEFVVEDRMNQRYDEVPIIDIWFGDKHEAIHFGKKTVAVEIL